MYRWLDLRVSVTMLDLCKKNHFWRMTRKSLWFPCEYWVYLLTKFWAFPRRLQTAAKSMNEGSSSPSALTIVNTFEPRSSACYKLQKDQLIIQVAADCLCWLSWFIRLEIAYVNLQAHQIIKTICCSFYKLLGPRDTIIYFSLLQSISWPWTLLGIL